MQLGIKIFKTHKDLVINTLQFLIFNINAIFISRDNIYMNGDKNMNDTTLQDVFLSPLKKAYEKSENKRKSEIISDNKFLEMGIRRVMTHHESGRSGIVAIQ